MINHRSTSLRFFIWLSLSLSLFFLYFVNLPLAVDTIPLPEHPRPDFQRSAWMNLNGPWSFRQDKENIGVTQEWEKGNTPFSETIRVPFPWGSKLSGVENKADIAWYQKILEVPPDWGKKRVYLVIGASDWQTTGWLDGHKIGSNRGGYTPFEFELTPLLKPGQKQRLVLRVDDTPHPFKLEGKQGYGPAKGIWQTVYLEARPQTFFKTLHFTPQIDQTNVQINIELNHRVTGSLPIHVHSPQGQFADGHFTLPADSQNATYTLPVAHPHLWNLDDPFLYEAEVSLEGATSGETDKVTTYFGMRKISVIPLPGSGFPYVALNNKPIYLQMTLDQAYHPEGFYTFPSDAFMRDEILRSRQIGLNTMRIHVKIENPRKLYWADRLGMLIMADIPNSWGEPGPDMQLEVETALAGMIQRDYNHPSIFSWVLFNETWGLMTQKKYLPETQKWVASLYRKTKELDPSRLVEDMSTCNYDHVETDLNSWHVYLPGYQWKEQLEKVVRDTFEGSAWNFIGGRRQAAQPLLNSECGNVWGYEGSTGDVDWSWDYHIMMNEFRRQPKIGGWLYTEHHDVINEWNGYYRFDRSEKFTGLETLVPGMSLRDLHSPFYISTGSVLCRKVAPGSRVSVPLYASFLTSDMPRELILRSRLYGWDDLGRLAQFWEGSRTISTHPWMSQDLPPLEVTMPGRPALAILALQLETAGGQVLHRNFCSFRTGENGSDRDETLLEDGRRLRVVRFAPAQFQKSSWSQKKWEVLNGLKVNGAGSGAFEYKIPWPAGLKGSQILSATLLFEASSKPLLGKDQAGARRSEGDFMRGKGDHDPSANPNSYPMSDTQKFPSAVRVRVNGITAGVFDLPDDPADHRGILSWLAQPHDKHLYEAGTYGYLIHASIPQTALASEGELVIWLEVDDSLPGGLAIYGEQFGAYPLDPTLIFELKK
jgi:hypothetical protein